MKFRTYKNLDLPAINKEVLIEWEENNIFKKTISIREGNDSYIFYEGPPSANGMPGIHHVMARAVKDIFCRYKTQKGYKVERKAGWDTHGLPVELGVEKALGITKEDIGSKISVEDYNKACREAVMKYTDVWNDLTKKIGYWVDTKAPYVTYKSKYMETVWWLLKEMYKKDMLYKGYTIQPYSPKAGTGLSSHELNQSGCYRDVSDTTVVAQFKAIKNSLPKDLKNYDNLHLLAWTTTPWTLPSNTALSVNPKVKYTIVKTFNQYTFNPIEVVLAENLVQKQFSGKYIEVENTSELDTFSKGDKKIPYHITGSCLGKQLINIKYEQLIPCVMPYKNPENAFRVIAADFVTTEDGTGIVHTAPTFGADDANAAKAVSPEVPPMLILDADGLPVPLVDLQGKFRAEVTEFAGKFVKNEYYDQGQVPEKSVDVEIAIKLKKENKAFKVEKYVHSYPHCWRTDKPVLYYPLDSWFVKVTDIKDRLSDVNDTINWKPKSTGEKRFGNWLKNANDWNLSRSRYWGVPLPIWRTEDGQEEIVIGSVEELKNEIDKSVSAGLMKENPIQDFQVGDMSEENYEKIDLHKNYMDKIVLKSESGQPMMRELDLIDVWFDSGSMPYAQWHYPFENQDSFSEKFPADFIAEGVDQTRGWFYTLHVIANSVSNSVAYRNVVSNGLVLDKNGQKMSKRLGNAVDPFQTLEAYGADAIRWYMIGNANPWDNLKFDIDGISEVKRKFFGTLYNTYSFFALYANIDGFDYSEAEIPIDKRPEIDRWILSELHSLIAKVDSFYADYEPTKAVRAISDFVQEHLSNWYVRLCRRRFWKGEYGEDKIAAYQTLYTCLLTVSKLAAPVAPFYMDRLYGDLTVLGKEVLDSVHLTMMPESEKSYIDLGLEQKMNRAQIISSLVLSLRKKKGIKVRQPLSKIMIPVLNASQKEMILEISDLIKSEVNVKNIEFLDEDSEILVKQIKPNFKVLGPRFGADMKLVVGQITQLSQKDIQKMDQNGELNILIDNKNVILHRSEVDIMSQDIEGCLVASQGDITLALDIVITEDLAREGIARELVNRIQNMRKDSGFEVTDKIEGILKKQSILEKAVEANLEYVKSETLMVDLNFEDDMKDGDDIIFDNIETSIKIKKV